MNISEASRKVLSKYPYLENYLALGVVNYRGLARLILPEVGAETGTQPNIQSVVSALRRVSPERRVETRRVERILGRSSLNIRYDMAALTVSVGESLDRFKGMALTEGTYILLQGMDNLTIVADEGSIKKARERLKRDVQEFYPSLAIVVVKSPKEITKTPGVLAYLANILALEEINIVEMMSSHAETAFIVEEKDALGAIEVFRREIKRSRSLSK